MIKTLNYYAKFTSTGKVFSQKLDFKPGLTVITGPNEIGKSLILEMIEYAWFGSTALRGQMSDYEVLKVDMEWETKGTSHVVSRHNDVQSLDKTKAVGAKAVNREILKILGIDIDVFHIACSAKQGELDKLTAGMGATERRRMVDQVIGLNHLEKVEGLCKAEANSYKRLKDMLALKVVEPIEPEEPSDYISSEVLDVQYKLQLQQEAERKQLSKVSEPKLPIEPVKGDFSEDVRDYETNRARQEAEREGIERTLRSISRADYSGSDLDYADEYYEQQKRGPISNVPLDQLIKWKDDWATIKRQAESVTCPKCGTAFLPGDGHLVEKVVEPIMSLREIERDIGYHRNWEDFTGEILTNAPVIPRNGIPAARQALAQQEFREKLQAQLDAIPVMESRAAELKRLVEYERTSSRYELECEQYIQQLVEWDANRYMLAGLPEPDPELENKLQISRDYEEQKRRFNASFIAYEAANAELGELSNKISAYSNGAEAIKFVRSQVKQHLVPSLNKVASHLLSEMTNGQRKIIKVDENFEVSVDGQPVRTLSGSGVSVVNLALRIALGQVLTQSVLPIFLADEIDHNMDADRVRATHDAIKSLTKSLKQIIVVSHKAIDGDNMIGLK